MSRPWYQRSRRRMLLDFHIAEWDPAFLAKFDPHALAASLKKANATSLTLFANTHTGLCNYPTKVGKMHNAFAGRDMLGETIPILHKNGIDVVIYYCLIYTDWYWDTHPDCRVVNGAGEAEKIRINCTGNPKRFSNICMNNLPYRQFVRDQIAEICEGYEFEGVWPDMTWWPTVCYCEACKARYGEEIGGDIPRVVDWEDPVWVRFQRKRQEWLLDFHKLVNEGFRRGRPGVSIAHQSGTFFGDWLMAPSVDLAREMDWLSADLYGERYGLSFAAKLFNGLSEKKPFEHINTWCVPTIHEHVVPRPVEHLRVNAFSALANDGAMVFIDAIDPDGSLHTPRYAEIGSVFKDVKPYEPHAGGTPVQDVAIYLSYESCFDLSDNKVSTTTAAECTHGHKWPGRYSHRSAALNLAKTLIQHHIPFGVITRKDLATLSRYQMVMLPDVVMMDQTEVKAFTDYVAGGGALYASKDTGIIASDGVRQKDFMLADLFGVSRVGETPEIVTYVQPAKGWERTFDPFTRQWPSSLHDTQTLVTLKPGAVEVAHLVLPWTEPTGPRFAAILTNPPGRDTAYPSIVMNRFGKGRVMYSCGLIETWDMDRQRSVVAALVRTLAAKPLAFTTNGPVAAEVILYDQPEKSRYIMCALNVQAELPNIPVHDMQVSIRTEGRKVARVRELPGGRPVVHKAAKGRVQFTIPRLDCFAMYAVEYGPHRKRTPGAGTRRKGRG